MNVPIPPPKPFADRDKFTMDDYAEFNRMMRRQKPDNIIQSGDDQ